MKIYRDDLEYVAVIASLPPQQTVFEYLVGCWKRLNSSRSALLKRVNHLPSESSSHNFAHELVVLGVHSCRDSASDGGFGEIARSSG